MSQSEDSNGQTYYEVDNVRITCLKSTFAGTPGLRIQSYRKDPSVSKSLNRGAEVPLPDEASGLRFVATILQAARTVRTE
jgi:hypothetical protein